MNKIIVRWNNETTEYFLLRGVKLSTQTDVLCQLFKVDDNPDKYALFFREHNIFLSDTILNDPETVYIIQDNSLFELNLAPVHHVDSILEYLNSENTLKKGLLGLKSHLQN
ncbi:hypothetical protein PPL_04499 [Heterostelium album PN500]|uniref:Uncharacterized protein n=1 Tax=Heterostelium pallidum (strain ATCC 26659 / Pp 5 / PN500) TaxID=670386 RepID=D3B7R1_HETP5|nr:hypothetical protein PPL_04499 [Heterostelium album PN500]EFA82804.1 hypothetical protein PPL_04499 [Heterostelium album PN500]|eukprot:XP_020434921.1 hypothetical protein PPL_04499 [Heterostelium album PN500]